MKEGVLIKKKAIIVLMTLLCAAMFMLPARALDIAGLQFATPNFAYALVQVDDTTVLFISFNGEIDGFHGDAVFALHNGEVHQLQSAHGEDFFSWRLWRMRIRDNAEWAAIRYSFGAAPWYDIAVDVENFTYTITEYQPELIRAALAFGLPTEEIIYRLLTEPEFVPEEPEELERDWSWARPPLSHRAINFLHWEGWLMGISFAVGVAITSLIFALIIRKRARQNNSLQN